MLKNCCVITQPDQQIGGAGSGVLLKVAQDLGQLGLAEFCCSASSGTVLGQSNLGHSGQWYPSVNR